MEKPRNIAAMSESIAAAKIGNTLMIRFVGGSENPTRYKVRKITGRKARELKLEGRRGAERWLVDGGSDVWIREEIGGQRRATKDAGHRRVLSVEILGRSPIIVPIAVDISIARARLPEGYDIGITSAGYVALRDGGDPVEVGREHANPWEAVGDAWAHEQIQLIEAWAEAKNQRDESLEDQAGLSAENAKLQLELDIARADSKRCRVALQQILETTRGQSPSGAALPKAGAAMPEQVAALVGQALRAESMRGREPMISVRSITDGALAWAAGAGDLVREAAA